jgi:cytosine/uracil/thiamine/allantoin permease
MIVDYYFIRKQQLNVVELYKDGIVLAVDLTAMRSLLCCWDLTQCTGLFGTNKITG